MTLGMGCVMVYIGYFVLQDKSWRVRYNVCTQLVDLCDALGAEVTR